MTEEEIKQKFNETYPEYMYGETPLSPYYDIFCYAIEIMEQETDKLLYLANEREKEQIEKMKELLEQIGKMNEELRDKVVISSRAYTQMVCNNDTLYRLLSRLKEKGILDFEEDKLGRLSYTLKE